MADISYTNDATERRDSTGLVAGKGDAAAIKLLSSRTIELAGSASGTTVKLGTVASNARIAGASKVYWDDLATSGSPTLDIGLGSVDSNVTSDPDALNDGLDVTSASSADLIKDHANFGKKAWEFVNGQTTDPGGALDIYGSVKDAATNATGTVTVQVYGYLD